ncbi:hypothetical protein [Desulfosporosinus sp.]|uniref:hypothetical protein n=1 Tax=Desulfosporosinus sp. TaxID=157907 RepID=UPI0025BB08D3|nr:hypothetical protein [Desulfosporosinus sp.]MBC2721817.1 hypothetical protein [Desulfosporosinus sp.]MBC2726279.1 hypothetical protein [Desulfosporosinus sp.]
MKRVVVLMAGVESYEVKLNYYAMAVAILTDCSIETAFEKLQSDHPDMVRPQISEEDYQDISRFKESGLYWTEIASFYNIPWYNLYKRVRDRKGKVG